MFAILISGILDDIHFIFRDMRDSDQLFVFFQGYMGYCRQIDKFFIKVSHYP